MATVRNIRGTSGRSCACSTWLDHWFNFTRSVRQTCAVFGCGDLATFGAHVYHLTRLGGDDWSHYIVPMCHPCNMSVHDLDLVRGVPVVPANIRGCTEYRR